MRKTLYIITGMLLFAIACNDEEYLDKKPHSLTEEFYTTVSGATQGLNAAYDILQLGEEVERIEFIGTVCSGDAMAGGQPGGGDQTHMQNFMRFLIYSDNGYVSDYWRALYRGIYRCNLLIQYLLEPDNLETSFTEDLRIRMLGEATFLRGLFHFKLQINYGGLPQLQSTFNNKLKGVPFVDHILLPDEWNQERPELEYTWGRIEEDFTNAASMLPEKSEYAEENIGRATKGAALSMLAKTYLYQEKWQQAYETAKQVIESGEYWLEGDDDHLGPFTITRLTKEGNVNVDVPGYKWIWQAESNNCGESVFDVQHYQEGSTAWPQGYEGNLIARYYGPRAVKAYITLQDTVPSDIQYFWGFILPTDYFVRTAYHDVGCEPVEGNILDPRYKLSVVEATDSFPYYYQDANLREAFPDSVPYSAWFNWPTTGRCTWKYFTDPYFDVHRVNLGDMPQNTKYLRFADVLLMGAEAAVHVGQNADALAWINWVRQRARNSGNTNYPQDYTGTATLEQIYAERRVELAFEGHQYYDLVRTGRAEQVLTVDALQYPATTNPETSQVAPQQFGDNFQVGKHEIWPIPGDEIINTNGTITQNPNYE